MHEILPAFVRGIKVINKPIRLRQTAVSISHEPRRNCQYPESVSVREWCRCKAATILIIQMVYQRVANAVDAPLSDAPQGGEVKQGNTGET
jgi:hypothetical protein